jgi:predicted transcriptional regulator
MNTAASILIEELVKQQRLLGISDQEFADLLGVSKALWIMTRQGNMPAGMSLLAGVVREFGPLKYKVLAVLAEYRSMKHSKSA